MKTKRERREAKRRKARVVPQAVKDLLALAVPQMPISQRAKIDAAIARIEKENVAAGLPAQTPVPGVVEIGPYVPGKSTLDRIVEAQDGPNMGRFIEPGVNTSREQARRLKRAGGLATMLPDGRYGDWS